MNVSSALKHINKKGMLLVFPQENKKEPPSLWYEFFPRTKMRWEWDENGDTKVSDLWMLREKLSLSRKTIYTKWFRGRATLISLDLFPAMLKAANPDLPEARGLTFTAREILDLLEEDSPLSTKQLKRLSGLQGRAAESSYTRALKELWDRMLIVAYGEVDEGAFPSLAVGSTKVLFEDQWNEAVSMSFEEAQEAVNQRLEEKSAFGKYWRTLSKKWAKEAETASHGSADDI
jgi:hypothetical protein